ncbi:MAG: alkaline phosphatase family protein [Flavobacteriales bacterium]|nr:alkaline phosphatase family protein [Flavobacteriales bacterium]
MKYILLAIFILGPLLCLNQIISGPMLGYKTMNEVAIWIQTDSEQQLTFLYHLKDDSSQTKSDDFITREEDGFTAHLVAKNLSPGKEYRYLIRKIDEEKPIVEGVFSSQLFWQKEGIPPNFSFAFGSCTYINERLFDRKGEPFGKELNIFESILTKKPDFMLWLGDNLYLRRPDWTSRSGIYRRYTHFKSQVKLQNFWKSIHHYAIWDDHDFGPNDADRSFINKEISLAAFKDFWANPSYGIRGKPGITSQFSYHDLDFFLLDNRYYRSPNERETGKREILGETQIQWLIDALSNSKASFKIIAIGGQLLSDAKVYENHATYEKERALLIDLIEKENLKNIVFLSGDRHKTELSEMKLENGNILYDFTSSPLASKAFDSNNEGNTLQVKGTHVATQNFGTISLKGDLMEREMSLKTFDSNGKLIWERKIEQQ